MPIVESLLPLLSTPYDGVLDCSRELPLTDPCVPVTVLAVSGEVDGCSGGRFARDLQSCVAIARPVIVDLSSLDFLGTRGVHILMRFDAQCRAEGLPWVTVTCPMADRIARVIGITGVLRGVGSLRAARWRLRGDLVRAGRVAVPLADRVSLQC